MDKTSEVFTLAKDLRIEPAQIIVKDIPRVAAYYRDKVGLDVLSSDGLRVVLGYSKTPILELIAKPNLKHPQARSAGLFHNAIVFKTRSALAATLLQILQTAPESFEGSADHIVSEAFYFHDPEHNGLELYFDRPKETWEWQDGFIKMGTNYLDPQTYIFENAEKNIDMAKKLGHIHLKVGDVGAARKFYVDILGFETTLELETALFVSAGGYHHHVGMNTWASLGAGKRGQTLGMGTVKFILPNDGSLSRLSERLDENGIEFEAKPEEITVNDPWDNQLVFVAES